MKKIILALSLAALLLIMLFRPAGKFTYDKSVSENRILFRYEIYGCGSIISKVIDGGEEIASKFKEEYPDIGTNEVVFTDDSREPQDIFDAAEFQTGGLAEKYTYIIEGDAVGVVKGARDCCDTSPAYNEDVVLFKVNNWYFTEYVPYITVANPIWILPFVIATPLTVAWLIISLSLFVANKRRKEFQKENYDGQSMGSDV